MRSSRSPSSINGGGFARPASWPHKLTAGRATRCPTSVATCIAGKDRSCRTMIESVVSNEERPPRIARSDLSNLVWLDDLDTRRCNPNTTSCVKVHPKHTSRCFCQVRPYPRLLHLINQTQALSTPDNLVGGAETRTIPATEYGLTTRKRGKICLNLMESDDVSQHH